MKTFTLFMLNLFFTAYSFAQSTPIVWGNPIKEAGLYRSMEIFAKKGNNNYVLRFSSRIGKMETYLEIIDGKSNQIKQVKMKDSYLKYPLYPLSAKVIGDNFYYFGQSKNKKLKQQLLVVQRIDPKTLLPIGNQSTIATTSSKGFLKLSSFQLIHSPDSTKFLVLSKRLGLNKGSHEISMKVFDHNMDAVWENSMINEYESKLLDIQTATLDNEGNVYLTCMQYDGQRKTEVNGNANYRYLLIKYANNGTRKTQLSFQNTDIFVTNLFPIILPTREILLAGFYSKKGSKSCKGTISYIIDMQGLKTKRKKIRPFTPAELSSLQDDKSSAKGKNAGPELNNLYLKRVIISRSGYVTFLAESYFLGQERRFNFGSMNARRSTMVKIYNFTNIAAVQIGFDGEVNWVTMLPKFQQSKDDHGYYSGFGSCENRETGEIHIIYNDHQANLTKNKYKDLQICDPRSKNSELVLATLSANGNLNKKQLLKKKDADLLPRPVIGINCTGNFLFLAEKIKQFQYATVEF